MRIPLAALCLCLLGGSGYAQTPGKYRVVGKDTEKNLGPDAIKRHRSGDPIRDPNEDEDALRAADLADMDKDGEKSNLAPVSLDCVPMATTLPNRFEPGGTGTLLLTLSLKGRATIAGDAEVVLNYAARQGPLTLAPTYSIEPPTRRLLEGPHFGRVVYDESVVFEVPVQVDADARPGEYNAALRAEFEVIDPKAEWSKGRFRSSAAAKVRIGSALSVARAAAATAAPATGGADSPLPGDARPAWLGPAGSELRTPPAAPAEAEAPTGPSIPAGPVRLPVILWIFLGAGALALAGVVGLLVARMRPS